MGGLMDGGIWGGRTGGWMGGWSVSLDLASKRKKHGQPRGVPLWHISTPVIVK